MIESTMIYRASDTPNEGVSGRCIEYTIVDAHEVPAMLDAGWVSHPDEVGVNLMDADGDGRMGGSIDEYDQKTDEELRQLIQLKGADVHHRTGRPRMLQILREEAA